MDARDEQGAPAPMTDESLQQAPGMPPGEPVAPQHDDAALGTPPAPSAPVEADRLPYSKLVIAGFVISCVSIFVFGFLGALGTILAARGLRAVRAGTARGRGLAIAAMVIGIVGFAFYAVVQLIFRFQH